jgi:GNAT superfamily N-acetyltransferase
VRRAGPADAATVAAIACQLLEELSGRPADRGADMESAARAIAVDESAGVLLVTEDEAGGIVGLLTCSWLSAVRTAGCYGLIQELWVAPEWRNRTVGSAMLQAIAEVARDRGVSRIEVGLPGDSYEQRLLTEVFYAENGFTAIGIRMRWLL